MSPPTSTSATAPGGRFDLPARLGVRRSRGKHLAPPSPRPLLLTLVSVIAFGTYGILVLAVSIRATSLDHPAAALLALACGGAALVPLALAFRDRDVAALADPLVLAGWLFWFPMFGVGGVALALGWFRPYYLDLLADPSAALAAAELWALVGFASFAAGASIPLVRRAGRSISGRLPKGDWPAGAVLVPALILVLAGLGVAAVALLTNRLGYDATTRQDLAPVPAYLQTIALVGTALLWFDLLRRPTRGWRRTAVTVVGLVAVAMTAAGLAESRGALAMWVLLALIVAALTRADIPRRAAISVAIAAAVALVVGSLVGSTYREIRAEATLADAGGTSEPSGGRLEDLDATFERIADRGFENVGYVWDRTVQRLEAPGGLAVIAGRSEELDGADTDAGAPRVVESVVGSFVPRVVWRDKPASTDPAAISRLYFQYEDNAFATTPMGDLLRDLGPIAVPLGMALMGMALRLVHASLVDLDTATAGRVATFSVLIVRLPMWLEGFYATFIADIVRVVLVTGVALGFVHLLARPKSTAGRDPEAQPEAQSATP